MGSAKANVLPDLEIKKIWNQNKFEMEFFFWQGIYPVLAAPMQSEPDNIFGMQFDWIGVGFFRPGMFQMNKNLNDGTISWYFNNIYPIS